MNGLVPSIAVAVHSGVRAKLSLNALRLLLLSCAAPSLPPWLSGVPARHKLLSALRLAAHPALRSYSHANMPIQKPSLPPSLRVLFP